MKQEKQRIEELDALRGICILGMLAVHFCFDLYYFGGIIPAFPRWFEVMGQDGHLLFILISGVCVTLGSHSFRRGILVFGGGLLVSYVTLFLDLVLGMENLRIWFGILHLLGISMMLWPLFRRLPAWALGALGAGMILLGWYFAGLTVDMGFLFPLGLCSDSVFAGSDFFPLFPGLGWFLTGAFLGKTIYKHQKSLLPRVPWENPVLRFFCACGRHSLEIYLLHQPILALAVLLIF